MLFEDIDGNEFLSPIISGCLHIIIDFDDEMDKLIAHYIGLSTNTNEVINIWRLKTYRPLYRAVYNNI